MSTTENLPLGAIVIDDERAATLNSFPLDSIVFDDKRVLKQEILHMSAPKIVFTKSPSGCCPVQAEGFIDG